MSGIVPKSAGRLTPSAVCSAARAVRDACVDEVRSGRLTVGRDDPVGLKAGRARLRRAACTFRVRTPFSIVSAVESLRRIASSWVWANRVAAAQAAWKRSLASSSAIRAWSRCWIVVVIGPARIWARSGRTDTSRAWTSSASTTWRADPLAQRLVDGRDPWPRSTSGRRTGRC